MWIPGLYLDYDNDWTWYLLSMQSTIYIVCAMRCLIYSTSFIVFKSRKVSSFGIAKAHLLYGNVYLGT